MIEILGILFLMATTLVGFIVTDIDGFRDLWKAGNIAGKFITILLILVLSPGVIFYFITHLLVACLFGIRDFLFPRKSGYRMKIPYNAETYKALQDKKIYCEHWGQIDISSSVIVFLCKADWEKALKHFPELTQKAQGKY